MAFAGLSAVENHLRRDLTVFSVEAGNYFLIDRMEINWQDTLGTAIYQGLVMKSHDLYLPGRQRRSPPNSGLGRPRGGFFPLKRKGQGRIP